MHQGKKDWVVERYFCWGIVLLLALAYLSHLGFYPLDIGSDEPIRSLVALEMIYSGDYITPTLNGVPYLNKPPLFNWMIIASYKLFGEYSSFALRFPAILSTFILGFVTYFFVRRHVNTRVAWVSALAVMTNGRILIYDSLQGLIDTTYAWITLLALFLVFEYGEKKKYVALFVCTWALTSIGFLLKGFSSVIFQGLTLLAYFIYTKNWKKLFHWSHYAGILVFLLINGAYYLVYFTKNEISPVALFENLFTESAKRTAFFAGFKKFIIHVLTYPFQLLYHYAPWMLLAIVFIRKDIREQVRSNSFIRFCMIIFLANIWVYWISPEIFARYIFMLLALIYTVVIYLYYEKTTIYDWRRKLIDTVFIVVTAGIFIGMFIVPFHEATKSLPNVLYKSIFLIIAFGTILFLMIKHKDKVLLYFILATVLFRIGFNWFVVEQRGKRFFISAEDGKRVATITHGKPLYIFGKWFDYRGSLIGSKNGISFNISKNRNEILRFNEKMDYQSFFLSNRTEVKEIPHEVYYEFDNYLAPDKVVLIKFLPTMDSTRH
jgi:4-amino-4-deoxy-L-arabinose transferase-like glycosyltransferase